MSSGRKGALNSLWRQHLKSRRKGFHVCTACGKPILGKPTWRVVGKVLRVTRPFHADCQSAE